MDGNIKGFIASVLKPSNLKILGTEERVTIDLFVNGRLREKDILKHVPTSRLTENYLYGQIHLDGFDDETDRFTSSREGIVADDPKFSEFLKVFSEDFLSKIINIWDSWRRKHRETGDEEDTSITPRERKSGELFNVVAKDYEQEKGSPTKEKVEGWTGSLSGDAQFNFGSYAECFISENLIRLFLKDQGHSLSKKALDEIEDFKNKEEKNKGEANISIDLRENNDEFSYLAMFRLASEVEGSTDITKGLVGDAIQYRPIRDALMHTALLTNEAKDKLTSVYQNIKARIIGLFSISDEEE